MAKCEIDECEKSVKRLSGYQDLIAQVPGIFAYEPRQEFRRHGTPTKFYFCSTFCLFTYLEKIRKIAQKI